MVDHHDIGEAVRRMPRLLGGEAMSDGRGYGGYGLWPKFERDRQIYEAREGGTTFQEIGERFGISTQAARAANVKYRRFQAFPPEVQRAVREIGGRGLRGLSSALHPAPWLGGSISRLSEVTPERLMKTSNIGSLGISLLIRFCERNGDMTEADLKKILEVTQGF